MASTLKSLMSSNLRMCVMKEIKPNTSNVTLSQIRCFPICTVSTNLGDNKIPDKFEKELVDLIADVLSKPKNLISVSLLTNLRMRRGDSDKPTATVDIYSIGVFDSQRNEVYTPKFFKFFTDKLKLPDDRLALIYHPLEQEQAGHLTYFRQMESKGK